MRLSNASWQGLINETLLRGGAGSDKHRLHDKHGFPNNLGLHLVVDCYEEELVQKEVWDFMKKIPAAVRRMWIDGFINDGFIGIHALHPGAAVKSLSGEHYEGIARWKIVIEKKMIHLGLTTLRLPNMSGYVKDKNRCCPTSLFSKLFWCTTILAVMFCIFSLESLPVPSNAPYMRRVALGDNLENGVLFLSFSSY